MLLVAALPTIQPFKDPIRLALSLDSMLKELYSETPLKRILSRDQFLEDFQPNSLSQLSSANRALSRVFARKTVQGPVS